MLKTLTQFLSPKRGTDCGDCQKRERYTLLNAAVDTVRGDFASDELHAERLAICKKCEYLTNEKKSLMRADRCKLCGCFVHLKARYAAASCDIQRW